MQNKLYKKNIQKKIKYKKIYENIFLYIQYTKTTHLNKIHK